MTTITNLNAQDGSPDQVLINNAGQIVYQAVTHTGSGTSTIFTNTLVFLQDGQATEIKAFTGFSVPTFELNNSGEVVAYQLTRHTDGTVTDIAISWQAGTTTPLGLFETFYAEPYGLDDSGRIYGDSTWTDTGTTHYKPYPVTFAGQAGALTPLGFEVTPPNFTTSVPVNIQSVSPSGDVLGFVSTTLDTGPTASATNPNISYSYLMKNGVVTQLNIAASGDLLDIYPVAINNSDQVVGFQQVATGLGASTAFFYQNGKTTILPSLGAAYLRSDPAAINNAGIVVGFSGADDVSNHHAVVWQDGIITDLNTLLPANSGWVLTEATGINDKGQVVGIGQYNNVQSAFELTLPTLTYSAAAIASAEAQGAMSSVTAISDSAANVSANLDALTAVAAKGDLGAVTLTDSGTPALTMTIVQVISDYTVLDAITGSYTIAINDSAANVSANFDGLQSLVTAGKVSSIALTDSSVLALSPTEVVNDTAALKAISGSYTLSIAAPAADSYIAGQAGVANTVTFTGNGSQYSITPNGDGTSFAITGNGVTDHVKGVQALQFADHTDIVASATPPVAGAVSSAQVTELYGAVFGRTPDVGGLSFYQTYAAAHPATAFVQFAEWFLASEEYTGNSAHTYAQTVAGDEQFITDSYQNLLHRAPSADEVSFYESKVIAPALANLTAGSVAYTAAVAQAHAQTLVYFSQSAEFLGDVQVTAKTPTDAAHWLILI